MAWHPINQTLDTRRPHPVNVAGRDLLLIHHQGRWWAIEDRCTHSGCAFSSDGEIVGHIAVCDCHGSEFDIRTGEVLAFPADGRLPTFSVRSAGEGLEVDL